MTRDRSHGPLSEQYERLIEAYRQYPEDHVAVANMTGLPSSTCLRMWSKGTTGKQAIKEVVGEEQRLARILRAEAQHQEQIAAIDQDTMARMKQAEADVKARMKELHDKAKVDAAVVLSEEATLISAARKVALSLHGLAAIILTQVNVRAFAEAYTKALQDKNLSVKDAQALIRSLSQFGKTLADIDTQVLQAERLRLGQPTEVVRVEVEQMDKDDALAVIDAAAAAAQLYRDETDDEQPVNGTTNGSGNGVAH